MTTGLPLPVIGQYSNAIGRPIDNTALASYMECPRKYYYSMVLHRRKRQAPAPALAYGTIWHTILELHYKGYDRASIHAVAKARWQEPESEGDYRTLSRALLEYDNYLALYGEASAESKSGKGATIGEGENSLVEIPVEVNLPGVRHPYTGKIDRVYERNELNYVEDHKTTSRLDKNYFTQWSLSNQMKGYASIAQVILGRPIAGVRINLHVCRKSDSEFLRDTLTFSQDILNEFAENLDRWMWRLETSAINASQGDVEAAYPANFNACAGKYSMCQYAGICSLGRRVRQSALEQDFDVYPWNPLEVEEGEA